MADSTAMPDRVLAFVDTIDDAGPAEPGRETIVLSPWWTDSPGVPAGVRPLRPLAQMVLSRIDLPAESVRLLDRWAHEACLPALFLLDGVGWWDRVRMAIRWDVYELVLWRHVMASLEGPTRFERVLVPPDRQHLAAVCRALGYAVTDTATKGGTGPRTASVDERGDTDHSTEDHRAAGLPEPAPSVSPPIGTGPGRLLQRVQGRSRRWLRRLRRLPDPATQNKARLAFLDARVAGLAARHGPMAISWAGAYQVVETGGISRWGNPYLDPAIDRLTASGEAVTVAVMGRSHRVDDDWAVIESDPRLIPFTYVRSRWRSEDKAVDDSAHLASALADPAPVFDVDRCDLGPIVRDLVATYLGAWLDERRRWLRRADRFLAEIRPSVLLIDREGTRMPWIAAAHRNGVPVVTTQHGMIYPGNPEYFRPRLPGDVRPDVTCVFGPYERDLLVGAAGYDPGEVVVTGSARVWDYDPPRADPSIREAVRRQLGVANEDRLLVVSAAHGPIGELLTACMLATVLDGALPGVHVVVKIHPQDHDPADYATFLAGLAAHGGYAAPAVSVVRDIDLLRLLVAADAHLGHSSTVLTDAVAAGLPNMVALGQVHADPIGYVEAGVAVAVRSVDDVRAFMANPRPPDGDARATFLAAHFLVGDATGRLADVLLGAAAAGLVTDGSRASTRGVP